MATAEQDRATVDAAIDGVPRGLPAVDIQDLYTAHWRYLVRLAVLLVDDVASAEDVVQDSFVALHKRAGTLRVPDAALAYLRTTVLNRSRSVIRRRQVARKHLRVAEPGRHPARGLRRIGARGAPGRVGCGAAPAAPSA